MDLERVVQNARDAIGDQSSTDYIFKPTQLPAQIEAQSRSLADMLRHSAVSTIAERYEARNVEAIAAQSDFRRAANRANWAVFLTAIFSALLLVAGTLHAPQSVILSITVIGAIAAAFATMFITAARNSKLLEEWFSRRAEAEAARRDYFERLFMTSNGTDSLLIRLEFFRRYQLDLQTNYFRNRRKDHANAARRLTFLSASGAAVSMLATTIAGALTNLNPNWVAVAGVSAITTAFAAFITTRESIFRYSQNAESFRQAQDALEKLRERLDDVRTAAALGQSEPVHQFVLSIHEQLMLEHQQWLKSSDSAQEALRRLQESLDKARVPKQVATSRQ